MTVLTKPSLLLKKTPLIQDNVCDEEVIEVHPAGPGWAPAKRSSGALLCMCITALVVAVAGITSGLMLYRQYLRTSTVHRYQGFCTVPITPKQEEQLIEPNYRVMPLRWSSDPDVQIFSTLGEDFTDSFLTALHEEFDIGDTVEKISVIDNGRRINFIHDFEDNTTAIIDKERCFLMEMDQSVVLPPAALVWSIERGAEFDVTRVRAALTAALPALTDLQAWSRRAALTRRCAPRPVYMLRAHPVSDGDADLAPVRKRSVDEPSHDYISFSGKHVQEIEINNLATLLEYEQNARNTNK